MYQTNETNQKTFIDKFFFSIYIQLADGRKSRQKTKKTKNNTEENIKKCSPSLFSFLLKNTETSNCEFYIWCFHFPKFNCKL